MSGEKEEIIMKNTMTNDYKRRIEIYIMWCIRKEDKNLHTSSPRKKMEYFIKGLMLNLTLITKRLCFQSCKPEYLNT